MALKKIMQTNYLWTNLLRLIFFLSQNKRTLARINNCTAEQTALSNQLAEDPESTAHIQRTAQATHCPDKQSQKIVQQASKCQCLKFTERKHSITSATDFKHKPKIISLVFCAAGSQHMPNRKKKLF